MFVNKNLRYLSDCYKNQKYDKDGNLLSGKRGVILEGSSRCFDANQLVITSNGNKKISELTINDLCLTFNHSKNITEYKPVEALVKQNNTKKCFKIILKDGTIIKCTEDHKFFYQQRYIELKNIISLWKNNYGNME